MLRRVPAGVPLLLAALLLAVPLHAEPVPAPDAPTKPVAATGGAPRDTTNPDPWLSIDTYGPDGPFVSYPATAAGTLVMMLAGGVGATVCMPIDLVNGLARRRDYGLISEGCGASIGDAAGSVTYVIAGVPFWLTKEVFWSIPRQLIGTKPAAAPPSHEPVPAPAANVSSS